MSGVQFAYDPAGNRTDSGGSYLTGNRISAFGGCSYTTDFDGNVSSRTCGSEAVTLAWSAESRLTSVTIGTQTVAFHYDALGRLVRKDVNGSPQRYFLWDRFHLLAELTSTGTAAVAEYSYYPGLDHLHAVIVGGQQYNAHTDAVGNVIALTDGAQTVQRTYEYDAWGQLTGGSDTRPFNNADRARWKGALWLGPELDLYYMRNRWYEPRSGRFLTEDPKHLSKVAEAPQSRFVCECTDLRSVLSRTGTNADVSSVAGLVAIPDNADAIRQTLGQDASSHLESWWAGTFASANVPKFSILDVTIAPQCSGINAYSFAGNDPVNGSDPSGLTLYCFMMAVGFFLDCIDRDFYGEWLCAKAAVFVYFICDQLPH